MNFSKLARNGRRSGRLMRTAAAVATIAQTVNRNRTPSSPPLAEVISAVPRMIQATINNEYQGLGYPKLGMLGAAVLYTVSPIDILPDVALAALGVVDDAVVLSWVAGALIEETEKFLAWEQATPGR